jgi:hypothetical protein
MKTKNASVGAIYASLNLIKRGFEQIRHSMFTMGRLIAYYEPKEPAAQAAQR